MTPKPTGRIIQTDHGEDLVLTRTFRAPIEDVWASVTEPERTARWFAEWSGEAAPGRTISLQMTMEGDVPPSEAVIEACEPPRHLALRTIDGSGTWRLELTLEQSGAQTELTFIHHLDEDANTSQIGPGWEYYLDLLVAARDSAPPPGFEEYYPAQAEHYRR